MIKAIKGLVIIAVFLLFGTLAFGLYAPKAAQQGTATPDSQGAHPDIERNYKPNEIIIKFKRPVADSIEIDLQAGTEAGSLRISNSLDALKNRFRLKNIQPLFKNFKQNRQRIKTLQQKDKKLLTKREKKILRRLRRAPKNAKIPELDRIYMIEVDLEPGQSLEEAVAAYNNDPDVEYAGFNHIISINAIPNDPLYPKQWSLNNTGQMYPASGQYNTPPGMIDCDIDAPKAWDANTGDPNVVVAVLDTGVDRNHRDLQGNMWVNEAELHGGTGIDDDNNGYIDDVWGYATPRCCKRGNMDDNGHGTHCAGIIAAAGNNGLDITGVCWNAKIMTVKCLDENGNGDFADEWHAIKYAIATGADVISMSFGYYGFDEIIQDEIDYAYSQGVIVVAAAGNDNVDTEYYPAAYDHVISVAATNSKDQRASFSNYGNWVDIAAPGVDILSLRADGTSRGTVYDTYTTTMSGTSMACPQVSGVIALMLSNQPELSIDQVTTWLLATADDISAKNPGYEGLLGSGRLNASNAARNSFINLNADVYSCDDTVSIQLGDIDLMGQSSQQVTVTTNAGDQETLTLTIQDVNKPGVFADAIATSTDSIVTENGVLEVSHGQIITVTYNDANDGTGSPVIVEAVATVDCQSPVVSNVQVTDISCTSAKMTFQTDEPATASIYGGLTCGGTYTITDNNSTLTTNHTFYLTELASQTDHYFVIDAVDIADNQTADSNGGQCYSFATKSPLNVPNSFPTIQAAINTAVDGDIVIVEPNTYTGDGNRDIDFNGLAITVRSINPDDSNIVAATIIDCNGTETDPHRGFYFHSGEGPDSVLAGFTITNGYLPWIDFGGGIYCDSNATISNCILVNNSAYFGGGISTGEDRSPTILNCLFTGNSASDGGGLFNYYNNTIVTNCTFTENSAASGAGLYNNGGSQTVTDCMFIRNQAEFSGGGMSNLSRSKPTITNCTFIANSADNNGGGLYGGGNLVTGCIFGNNSAAVWGGGIYTDSSLIITNCTFYGNLADEGGGIRCRFSGKPELTNCILWANSDSGGTDESAQIQCNETPVVNYSCIQNWTYTLGGTDNIDTDPCFADPNNGDYHLKSQTGRWYPSIYTDLDPTLDSFIDLSDLAAFANLWHKQGLAIPADLDNSGIVDSSDLTLLLNSYLSSYLPQGWLLDNVNSPCIDAGDPISNWTAELWPHGKRINMGAYGGTTQASMSLSTLGNKADLNNTDSVDGQDLALLLQKWLAQEILLSEDINRNGIVNLADLAELTTHWLWQE